MLKVVQQNLVKIIPQKMKESAFLTLFGLLKIPLIFFVSPKILEMNERRCSIKIPLNYRTKNHLNAMYFGTLSIGADVAGGLLAMKNIYENNLPLNMVFKDFHAEFLKRADGDVVFTCEDGEAIKSLVSEALESGERKNLPVIILATVPAKYGAEPVAKFTLTLSIKKKN